MNQPISLRLMCQTTSSSRPVEGKPNAAPCMSMHVHLACMFSCMRREIVMLKSLWDTIDLVKHSFSNWNTTLWCDINVDQMELDCKKFVKVKQ